jgi:2-aminoadipate transaminase
VLAKVKLGKQAADLCTSSLTQQFVNVYFEQERWRRYVKDLSGLYRDRRDAMLDALAEFFPPEAEWTRPAGGLFIWATLPDFIDTGDLLAKAIREEQVAFVPGAAAYVDGRGGSSMRLNFSGADSDDIREGIKRIGKVVREQIALYGTFTGRPAASEEQPQRMDESREEKAESLAEVVRLPERTRERRGAKGG